MGGAAFGTPCQKWAPYGSFLISINESANMCAIAFTASDRPDLTYNKMESLSYIGPDDWECRTVEESGLSSHELLVARMSHGKLAVHYLFSDGQTVPVKFTVRSRSGSGGLSQLFGN